ncbi:Gfo/Idh/MocA family protein [Rhodohalobacter mucosus]|uniref:Oxidoreductase n=1 Tax=Rhodohalobacter mucosus TaxID=2079485 RepID=A0A316U268_9BACT|nr:Gfo/Idh/MocA family oxidoreductase [Rhodohalobacter mucosus]PWN07226.1 oxidoreductase [Rhodohalobacter mucosus]
MDKIIKWGILGPGNIATLFADDLQLSDRAILQGVASRNLDKARDFSSTYQSHTYYGSYEELADDPDIDVIYIATPHPFHCEQTLMCLQKGKSVLCEKPMGMNATEMKSMFAEARARNLFLMEGMWTRFIPATKKLLQLLNEDAIGELLFMRADFGFKSDAGPESRLFKKSLGGGSLLDIGIYPVYLSLLAFGLPHEIKAMARMTKSGVDSYCSMLFGYADGAKAVLESTFEAETPTEATLFGSRGSIKLQSRFHHSENITITLNGEEQNLKLPYRGNGYFHEIEEVNDCLLNKKTESSNYPLQTSLDLITVLDHVRDEISLSYNS